LRRVNFLDFFRRKRAIEDDDFNFYGATLILKAPLRGPPWTNDQLACARSKANPFAKF
jgi:hypothetical protein